MAGKQLSVVVTRRLPDVVETRMKELFDARLRDDDTRMTREELLALVPQADVLVPTLTDKIDAEVMDAANGRLRLIANYGQGSITSMLRRLVNVGSWSRTRPA